MATSKVFESAATLLVVASLGHAAAASDSDGVTVYQAKHILTVDAAQPHVQAVAVQNGLIAAVGSLAELQAQYPGAKTNRQFSGKTIIPGLIDPHVHMVLGSMIYALDFVPPWDMETPKGIVRGLPEKTALMQAIREFAAVGADSDAPLILYGYHNLVQGELTRQDLDAISQTRPIFIWHYSGHDYYLNSAAIELAGLTPALVQDYHGIDLDENGALTGRIYEDALPVLFQTIGPILLGEGHISRGWTGYEAIFSRSGITTVAEMGYGIFGKGLEDAYRTVHYGDDDNYRLYLVPEHRAFAASHGGASAAAMIALAAQTDERAVVLPQVKLFTDAAFYSQTMKMAAPGYTGGQSAGTDGLWVTTPDALPDLISRYWDAGLDIHIHSNGDAAQDSTLAAFAAQKPGTENQRLIIEHGGIFTPEQVQTAAELGVGISAASHYVHYMGDDYRESIGEKADAITPLRSSIDAGMHVTLHSDAPLAPPNPLKAAGAHMTRLTRQGNVSNIAEQLTAMQALTAVTLDAAWSLGLEDELGSITVGKRADFTILEANPLDTAGEDWGTIPVWGTVVDGKIARIGE